MQRDSNVNVTQSSIYFPAWQEDLRSELLRGGTKPVASSQASLPLFFRPSYQGISNGAVSMSLAPSCSTYASTRVDARQIYSSTHALRRSFTSLRSKRVVSFLFSNSFD